MPVVDHADPVAVFEPDGDRFVPTAAAAGPWDATVLHGAAVSALLAGLLDHGDEEVTVRVLVDLLGPAPSEPLQAQVGPVEGGRTVRRQTALLSAGGRPIARGQALRLQRSALELPGSATTHESVFDPADAPDLGSPNSRARQELGWESFDSIAMAACWEPRPSAAGRQRLWLRLMLPVVAGRPPTPLQNVVAAADYASGGTAARLDFRSWSFVNADLVVSLCRPPVPGWVGLECDGMLSTEGTGQSIAAIYDARGLLGQSSQSLLVRARRR